MRLFPLLLAGAALNWAGLKAQTPDQVLVIVNHRSPDSREIGRYYIQKRRIPPSNLCTIDTAPVEEIDRKTYAADIETPVGAFLKKNRLDERILFIVTTLGVPLKVRPTAGQDFQSDAASVDSELTLLYEKLRGKPVPLAGPAANPFFRQRDAPFRHPQFPIYLVTRLAAYGVADVKAMIDRAANARNAGNFVIDARGSDSTQGNQWLRNAALLLPKGRVIVDDSPKVLKNQKNVIGYASWGSNDRDRKERVLQFTWLPGAIATEFVSFDGRTFVKPPDSWQLGNWENHATWYAEAPQTLTADYIHEGASGASGQVYEPFLGFCPRPDFVLPAYYSGRTLAESFYMGMPGLSWMNVVIGDPLMRLRP